MKILLRLILIIVVIAVVGCRHSQAQSEQTSYILPIDKLATYENYSILHVNPTWIVAAYSEHIGTQDSRSEILAYRLKNNKWHKAFSKILEHAYNARIELRRDMQYGNNPIIVLRVQYGAGYEEQEVYAISKGSFHLLQTLGAGMFEWSYLTKDSRVILIGIPAHVDEKLIFFKWNGAQFQVDATLIPK